VATFHGWSVRNFPNCLMIIVSQSGATPNYTHSANDQARHLAYVLSYCKKHGIRTVEPSAEGEAAWLEQVLEAGKGRTEFLKECTPGYYNDEGKTSVKVTRDLPYGGGGPKFLEILKKWTEDDRLEGLERTYA
jgi:cyclohexanone monooxygenase